MRYQDIEDAERQLESMRETFLRSRGWRHSCNNVTGLWLWQKTIDGVDHRLAQDTALFIEARLDDIEDICEEPADDDES